MMRRSTPCALIVGGDGPTQLMLRYLLTREGCDVVAVDDVYAVAQAAPPALITLVVVVAGPSDPQTLATLASLRRRGYQTPTVVLADMPSHTLRHEAFALGAADVVALPARAADLCARLRVALRREPRTPGTVRAGEHTVVPDSAPPSPS